MKNTVMKNEIIQAMLDRYVESIKTGNMDYTYGFMDAVDAVRQYLLQNGEK